MADKNKKRTRNYGISLIISFVLTLLIHYLALKNISMHPTINVGIGLIIFFVLLGVTIVILDRYLE